jgi:hypothetical protein
MSSDLRGDVLVRAWEPDLSAEGARFKAVTVRRAITMHTATNELIPEQHTVTMPGLVVIAPSAGPGGQNAVDVVVRAIPDRIKFTILSTPELVWLPVNATRDALMSWSIECVAFTEWIRLRLGDTEPDLARSQDGR